MLLHLCGQSSHHRLAGTLGLMPGRQGPVEGLLWRESFRSGLAPCEVSPYLAPFASYSKASCSFWCSYQLDGHIDPTLHLGRGHGAAGPDVFPSHTHSSFGKETSAPASPQHLSQNLTVIPIMQLSGRSPHLKP